MKLRILKTGMLLLLVTIFVTSCSKKESNTIEEESTNLTVASTQKTEQAEINTDKALFVIESAYAEIEEDAGKSVSLFSDCVTITISTENEVTFVTLDFGLGCELQNGNIVSGKIHITYTPIQNGTRTINYTFDDFTINGNSVEGGGTLYRERCNASGNPQSTFHHTIVVTFTDGVTATLNGIRVREWIERQGSGAWMDNVFLVTGNWSVELLTGFLRSAFVLEALRR